MSDVLFSGVRASATAPLRTLPFAFTLVFVAACMAAGSAHAQAAGTIRPSVAATQAALAPDTAVAAPVYRSAFAGLPQGVETGAVDWRRANAQAAQFPRGHADLLKWEQKNPAGVPPEPRGARP